MELRFTKMNGAGNDFVVIDNRARQFSLDGQTIARLCDRHRGVGADGLLAIEPAEGQADFRMRYYNADGGEAEMCGNGARCFARFSARLMPEKPESVSFETQAGVIVAKFEGDLVSLDMGRPTDHRTPQVFDLGGANHEIHFLNTGVPHAVVFVSDVETVDVHNLGRTIRRHEAFAPKGTNANFAQAVEKNHLVLRTYERGVEGETLACGTGVCATALLHALAAGAASPVHVTVRGGDTMRVDFTKDADGSFATAKLTGPADFVFDGVISL
ncbi:MAG: diaminopimelate epimerase [Spartobacteria bacterium AMD-G5]|nr:MAG: diaminopimelate epimerase [Spartobacteria bacterium AMD-G5]